MSQQKGEKFRTDCLHYKGNKPCTYNRLCDGCKKFAPMGKRILIIKLVSIGDVLRTTPILRSLKEKYNPSYIVWLTSEPASELLVGNPLLDEVLPFNLPAILRLQIESFDIVISLDKAVEALAVATSLKAKRKFGYGLSITGRPIPLNIEAKHDFSLGLSNELKFRTNKKSYQELIFETVGLKFKKQEYILPQDESRSNLKRDFLQKNGLKREDLKVGLNTGCGDVFPNKRWTREGFVRLAQMLLDRLDVKVILLGGAKEKEWNTEINEILNRRLIVTPTKNSLMDFIAFIDCCDLVVSADTLAMHIAIGLKKKIIALFGPTCPQEIEMYGRGIKISAQLDCAPCYKNRCEKNINCMQAISPDEVFSAICHLGGRTDVIS